MERHEEGVDLAEVAAWAVGGALGAAAEMAINALNYCAVECQTAAGTV